MKKRSAGLGGTRPARGKSIKHQQYNKSLAPRLREDRIRNPARKSDCYQVHRKR